MTSSNCKSIHTSHLSCCTINNISSICNPQTSNRASYLSCGTIKELPTNCIPSTSNRTSFSSCDTVKELTAPICNPPPSNLHLVGEMINSTEENDAAKPKTKVKKLPSSEQPMTVVNYDDLDELDEMAAYSLIDCDCLQTPEVKELDEDHRLGAWMRMLQQRNTIATRIMQRTGKAPCQLLFNRAGTVDDRDKIMVQRLLEHAERMNPSKRHVTRHAVYFDRCDDGRQKQMELMTTATPPRPYFEISGIPECTKKEMIGENCCCRRSQWLSSKAVQEGIKERGSDIKRLVPFFPDIENLQVVGSKVPLHDICDACLASSSDYNVNDFNGAVSIIPNKSIGFDLDSCMNPLESDNDFNLYSDSISNLAKCHELFWN